MAWEAEWGYNQLLLSASKLAPLFSVSSGVVVLFRIRLTTSQARLQQSTRWDYVPDAFVYSDLDNLSGLHVLLVGDVATIAATLDALAAGLLTQCVRTKTGFTLRHAV